MPVSQERLKELFHYDPETGVFRRLVNVANVKAGTTAGSLRDTGYIAISVDNRLYRAHVLAWLWMTGELPAKFIDHIDADKANNRWSNLRAATKSQNGANRPAQANSKSKLKGAYFYPANGRWQSTIQRDGKTIYLGYFDTAEQAHAAYCVASQKLYGEFARAA